MKKNLFKIIFFLAALNIVFFVSPYKALALSWDQVNTDGFGDANNWGNIHMILHGDYIYAGISNDNGTQVWRSSNGTDWSAVNTDGFGDVNNFEIISGVSFNGYIYLGTGMILVPDGAQIWRSATGDVGTWLQANTSGFADNNNYEISSMAVFQNHIYAGTCNMGGNGGEIWNSATGTSWSQSGSDGLGDNSNTCIRALKVFNGYLYAGTFNAVGGSQLYRTSDGVSWDTINTDGLGDANNTSISCIESYSGNLYIGTINLTTGGELWRSSTGDAGSWVQVNADGFGDVNNIWVGSHGLINRNLFMVGTRNDATGAELWGTIGDAWGQEGPDGFGDANNYALYAITYKDRIYIAFSNSATGVEIWRSEYAGGMIILPSDGNLTGGNVGTSYQYALSAAGVADPVIYYLSSGSLPPGLVISSDGVIFGIPNAVGDYCFQISAYDGGTPALTDDANYCISIGLASLPETGKDLISFINLEYGIKVK